MEQEEFCLFVVFCLFTENCGMCVPTLSRQKGMVNEDDETFPGLTFLALHMVAEEKICVQFQVKKLVRIDISHNYTSFFKK